MTMGIDKCILKDSETTILIHIKNDGKTVTCLDDFRLKANIAETGGTGSILAYLDADDNRKGEAEIDELLTHFFERESLDPEGSVTTELQVQPGASVSHAVINLELYDTNEEKIVATKTVTWAAASYSLSFSGIPDSKELKGSETLLFQIKNEGDKVNTDDITVCLNSTNSVVFDLNGTKSNSIKVSLKDILGGSGSTNTLAKGTSTGDITLKLANAQGNDSSEITLELKKHATLLKQKTVQWTAKKTVTSPTGEVYIATDLATDMTYLWTGSMQGTPVASRSSSPSKSGL